MQINLYIFVVRTRVKGGDNSFVVAAATLWNALPNNFKTSACLATFKARLKTLLSACSRSLV